MFKKTKNIIITLLALAAVVFVVYSYSMNKEVTTINADLITNRLENAKELTTTKYHYTNVASFSNQNEFYGWQVPFTEKKFIVSYDGTINVGVDLEEMLVTVDNKTINITIPEPKILSHEIDEESLQVFDEKNSIFNPIRIDDYNDFSKDQKDEMEKNAISKGLLVEAKESTKKAIVEILNLNPTIESEYEIVFN